MGLTPMEAIVAATRDSADVVHLNTGLIAPGKNADFTVLDAIRWKTLPIPGRSAESSYVGGKWTELHCARSGKPDGPEAVLDL